MTEDEKEEMDGSWVIDPSTEEKIVPNISSQRTRHPMPDHQQTEATTHEQRPGSL